MASQFIDKGQGDDSPNFRIFQRYCCDGKSMCKISLFQSGNCISRYTVFVLIYAPG